MKILKCVSVLLPYTFWIFTLFVSNQEKATHQEIRKGDTLTRGNLLIGESCDKYEALAKPNDPKGESLYEFKE